MLWSDKWRDYYELPKKEVNFKNLVVVRWYKRFYDSCLHRLINDEHSKNLGGKNGKV